MTTRHFLSFQATYWITAAVILFLYGLQFGHWHVALIRNLYFPVVGFAGSTGLIWIYRDQAFLELPYRWALVGLICLGAGLITSLILNPITFALLGDDISQELGRIFSTQTIMFVTAYGAWSFMFLDLEERAQRARAGGNTDLPEAMPTPYLQTLPVGSGREIRSLDLEDAECILASGDYVEFATADRTYLKKISLSRIGNRLDPRHFVRVHRSTIVNLDKVKSVRKQGRGSFEIQLASGRRVKSSRSYQDAIVAIFPKA